MKVNWKDIIRFISFGIGLAVMIAFGGYLLFNGLFPADPNAGLSPETLEQSKKYYNEIRENEINDIKIEELKRKVE